MIQSICVCGAGTMGIGIAQVSAQSGFNTILYDVNEEILNKAKDIISRSLDVFIGKSKIRVEDKSVIEDRIQFVTDINSCTADLVIEAIIERLEAKRVLFQRLSSINNNETIFATNTSSLSITEIADALPFPERIAGMHFFNPAHIMKLVEIVHGNQTNEKTIRAIFSVSERMGKTAVLCKDAPGFIVNHVARPYYLEALKLVELGITDIETIDHLMEATGFKMGPFRLMDLIGNDINYAVSCSVYEAMNKSQRLEPSPIQQEKVKRGELGRKTGKGYYGYEQ